MDGSAPESDAQVWGWPLGHPGAGRAASALTVGPHRCSSRPQPWLEGVAHAPSSSTFAKPPEPGVFLFSAEAVRSRRTPGSSRGPPAPPAAAGRGQTAPSLASAPNPGPHPAARAPEHGSIRTSLRQKPGVGSCGRVHYIPGGLRLLRPRADFPSLFPSVPPFFPSSFPPAYWHWTR